MRAFALLAVAASGCVSGDGGAVVVRWRLIDQALGSSPAGCMHSTADSSWCCISVGGQDLIIDSIVLRVVPVVGGAAQQPAEVTCQSCSFPCSPFEHTTHFEIPPGTYLLSLEARRCGMPVGLTPPGVVRSVRAGEITNLDAIEIAIPIGTCAPLVCGDGGATSCGDGGA
jgi:hypothetical protein